MNRIHKLKHLFIPHHTNNQRAKLLHPSSILGIIGFIFIFQIFLRTTSVVYPDVLGYASRIPVSEIVSLTNQERQTRGLSKLTFNSELSNAAAKKAADMFSKNYWAHVSPTGTQPWFFITQEGYTYRYAGENLARDFTSAPDVVAAWIASPSHKENLLSGRYQDIGVAVVDGVLDGRETTLVVQMFGTKLSATNKPSLSDATSISVKAAEPVTTLAPEPTKSPTVNSYQDISYSPTIPQYSVNQYFVIILLSVFALVIAVDIIVVYRKSLMRWTSKSFAHLVFVLVLLIAVAGVLKGQIL